MTEPRPSRRKTAAAAEPRPARRKTTTARKTAAAAPAEEPRPVTTRGKARRGSFLPEQFTPATLRERLRGRRYVDVNQHLNPFDQHLSQVYGLPVWEGEHGLQAQVELAGYLAPRS